MTTSSPGLPSVEVSQPARTRSRTMLWWGLGLLLAALLLGLAVRTNVENPFTQGLDDAWYRTFGLSTSAAHPVPVSAFFDALGRPPGMVLILVIVVGLLVARHWRSAVFVLAVEVAANVVAQVLKHIVDRPRPLYPNPWVVLDHGSYPSGHLVTVAGLVVAIGALFVGSRWARAWCLVAVLLVIGTIWQRTYIGAHWLSDTLAGTAVGVGVGLVLWWALGAWIARDGAAKRRV